MTTPHARGVTIVAITSVAREATVAALRHSLAQIRFDRALLLCDKCPKGLVGTGIEWRQIEPLASRQAYSSFVLHQLADQIETEHALLIQWDGFVRDGSRWNELFLDYDYIGAAWPQFQDERNVGNGGFSLRSKRLLEATRQIEPDTEPEDVAICRTNRHLLETKYNLRFAGLAMAREFSYEREVRSGNEFGFHGAFNLFSEVPPERMRYLMASLEPGFLGRSESVEVFLRSLALLDFALARIAFRQVLAHDEVARRLFLVARRLYFERKKHTRLDPVREKSNGS